MNTDEERSRSPLTRWPMGIDDPEGEFATDLLDVFQVLVLRENRTPRSEVDQVGVGRSIVWQKGVSHLILQSSSSNLSNLRNLRIDLGMGEAGTCPLSVPKPEHRSTGSPPPINH